MNTVPVTGVACPCPGTPHPDGDTVELRERLDLPGGVRLQQIVIDANNEAVKARKDGRTDTAGTNAILAGQLAEAYMQVGVVAWTFVDDKGKPVPVTPETIQSMLVEDFAASEAVAQRADEMYLGPVLGPLVKKVASSSPGTQTGASTSPTSNGRHTRRTRSKPSSTSTIPTADTEAT